MTIDVLGGSTAAATSNAKTQAAPISQEDFLKILLTQLNYQDPLKPLDNQAFLAQMAQFSALEQTQETNSRIDTLLSIQSASQSIGLIGKTVDVATSAGATTGVVTELIFKNGQPSLTVTAADHSVLNGISLSQISLVR